MTFITFKGILLQIFMDKKMLRFLVQISFSCLLSCLSFAGNTNCIENHCIGVVDVGSTGSRLHVYAFQDNGAPVEEIWSQRVKPGLASLPATSFAIESYLSRLFENAPEEIPIYFYATAGMRLLPSEVQDQYYSIVRAWFEHSFWNLKSAKTISGREEGVFAWLAVHDHVKQQYEKNSTPRYLSVMDMGGASVQVVSAVDAGPHVGNPKDYIDIKLDGKIQTLFVRSFLGLGQNLVLQQFLNETHCFPDNYLLPDGGKGKGHIRYCSLRISKLIDNVHEVHRIIHPDPLREWYILGGLTYLAKQPPFEFNDESMTNNELYAQAENKACHRLWDTMKRDYPEEKELSRGCIRASYYHALIKAFGISSDEPIRFMPGQSNIDWTLGVILHER